DGFCFEPDIDDRVILLNRNDVAVYDLSLAYFFLLEALLKHVAEGELFSILSVRGHPFLFPGPLQFLRFALGETGATFLNLVEVSLSPRQARSLSWRRACN